MPTEPPPPRARPQSEPGIRVFVPFALVMDAPLLEESAARRDHRQSCGPCDGSSAPRLLTRMRRLNTSRSRSVRTIRPLGPAPALLGRAGAAASGAVRPPEPPATA